MIIIDTHVWIWYASHPEKISRPAIERLHKTGQIGVSAISCWEVAMLVAKERLALKLELHEWITKALQLQKIKLIPLLPSISVLSSRLPGNFHGDPADRIIVASSLELKAELVTKDQRILDYKFADTVW